MNDGIDKSLVAQMGIRYVMCASYYSPSREVIKVVSVLALPHLMPFFPCKEALPSPSN